ncbi:hypothetical protein GGR57DRAFT_192720 [Xylariaceae sp. FL1272]|nr:hypothetical protein GGR57DRAFT_192720 [Xylariaceae sp. FL1272]
MGDFAHLEHTVMRTQQPPKDWERWIFAESLRRTIVMAYAVIWIYKMLQDSEDEDPGPWAFVHRFTLCRPLWEASSSVEFQRLWKQTPQFIISNFSFEKFLENGRGSDVDEFAEIMLSVYMGRDAAKEFISSGEEQPPSHS